MNTQVPDETTRAHGGALAGTPCAATPRTAQELRDAGSTALGAHRADEAETAYAALLQIIPDDIYALVGLGFAARLRGNRNEALRRFEAAAAIHPSNAWPLLEISAENNALGLPDQADAALRRALEHNPGHYFCLMAMGRAHRRRGAHAAAAEAFDRAVSHHPARPAPYLELAGELAEMGRLDEALDTFDKGAASCPDKSVLLSAKARLLGAQGRGTEALEAWTRALAAKPEEPALKLEITAQIATLGRPLEALAAYQAIVQDSSISAAQRRDAAFAASKIARSLGNQVLYAELLEVAVAFDPNHTQTHVELAHYYRGMNRLAAAETAYRKILPQSPTNLHVLGGLANVRRQLGDHEEALKLLQAATGADPNNEWIRFELGITLRDVGRIDECGATLELIDPPSSMYVSARMSLAQIARDRGALHWAIAYYEQAARFAADPSDAFCQIASVKRALGDLAGAEAAIARAFAHNPDTYHGHMANGYLKRATGEAAGARAAFARAAVAKPNQPQPHIELAAEESELGNQAAAAAAIDAALALDPQHEGALLKKAASLADLGDTKTALSIYRQLQNDRPASIWAYLAAAQILVDQGEYDAGLAILAAASKTCPATSHLGLRKADILRRQGLVDDALEVLSSVCSRYRTELAPWCHLASLSIDLGLFANADALLQDPPQASGKDQARIIKIRSQLNKAKWNLTASIDDLSAIIQLDARDSSAFYERAKLHLITFKIAAAYDDLLAHSALRAPAARREGRSAHISQTHVGQLYDEFTLDRELARNLDAASNFPPDDRIDRFAELVRRCPDSTAPAIGLMIALRQAGRFDRVFAPDTAQPRIPRVITQFWNDLEPPPDIRYLMNSWSVADPSFKVELFNDVTAQAYLRQRCGAAVARAFRMATEPAQRADIFRLGRLYAEGGFFIDADDRARAGLTGNVPPDAAFFAHHEDLGSIGNNVIGAEPGHPVIEAALRDAATAILRGDRDIIWLSTGPGLLTRALARWFAADPAAIDARIGAAAILTLAEMRRAAAMHCHAAYKTTHRAWLNAAFPKRKQALSQLALSGVDRTAIPRAETDNLREQAPA